MREDTRSACLKSKQIIPIESRTIEALMNPTLHSTILVAVTFIVESIGFPTRHFKSLQRLANSNCIVRKDLFTECVEEWHISGKTASK